MYFCVPLARTPCSVISGFRREVAENCALLGYYSAGSGNFLSLYCFPFSVLYVLFVCKRVMYCCHRVSTQLRLYKYNISISNRRFGTTYRSYLQGSRFRMEPIGCPEPSVRNYQYSLRNTPEEHSL
jgi:hypothetical protein